MLKQSPKSVSSFLKHFKNGQSGNVSIMFAGTILAVMAGTGLAVDGSQMRKFKQELQHTVDGASLAIAKDQLSNQAELDRVANGYLDTQSNLGAVNLDEASKNGTAYTVSATLGYQTSFMHLFGYDVMPVSATSTTIYDVREINLSLVLDTTGSMSGSKMASLKVAANDLITSLENVPGNSVKVSVVPFAQYVNVGPINSTASFMNVTTGGWNGCVGSRAGNLAEKAAHSGSDFPGLPGLNCGTPLLPLTDDMNSARASVNSMVASGWTYIPAGIAWGWRTLSVSEPFTEISTSNGSNSEKIMIVMTDGANTRSKVGETHNGWNKNDANTATSNLCTAVKTDDITVYTIAYELNDVTTQNMLRSCATVTGNYFQADNSGQLASAFSQISASIQTLRLTN